MGEKARGGGRELLCGNGDGERMRMDAFMEGLEPLAATAGMESGW